MTWLNVDYLLICKPVVKLTKQVPSFHCIFMTLLRLRTVTKVNLNANCQMAMPSICSVFWLVYAKCFCHLWKLIIFSVYNEFQLYLRLISYLFLFASVRRLHFNFYFFGTILSFYSPQNIYFIHYYVPLMSTQRIYPLVKAFYAYIWNFYWEYLWYQ